MWILTEQSGWLNSQFFWSTAHSRGYRSAEVLGADVQRHSLFNTDVHLSLSEDHPHQKV